MNNLKIPGFIHLALLGAVVATLCDANHVFTGTLSYAEPVAFGQAWWVFPGFVFAFLTMGVSSAWLAGRCRPVMPVAMSESAGGIRPMVESLVLFAMVYLASGFGNESPQLLSLVFYGTFFLRLAVTYERGWAFVLAVVLGVGGMFAEGLLSLAGQVAYRHVDVFGVPFWLGALYMHGALALRESMRFFVYRQAWGEVPPGGMQ